jgi:uncharacterized protein
MNIFELSLLIWLGAFAAGILGAITGLGGGVVIIPLLTLGFGFDIRYAIGASLISVIATSSGAASAYVKEGFTNIRIGIFLEIATILGALTGAFLASYISGAAISIIFGVVLIYSSYLSYHPPAERVDSKPDAIAAYLKMNGSYPSTEGPRSYCVHHVPLGFIFMMIAGTLSGLLGIGAGAFKVLAMDRIMQIPFKVSTTTSNFMIGVTAAASAGVYLRRGYIDAGLTMPVVLGVLLGAFLGAKLLIKVRTKILRLVFSVVIALLAIEMIYKGFTRVF